MIAQHSLVGSHVATAGSLVKVGLREAIDIGAEVIQLFAGNPRSWIRSTTDTRAMDVEFRSESARLGIPVFVHVSHLINFGSPSAVTLERSAEMLAHTMLRAEFLGAVGVVLHAGSAVGGDRSAALKQVRESLLPIVDAAPPGLKLLIEPTAGGGGALASDVASILSYFEELGDERLQLCLDTCHLHSAGEDLSAPSAMQAMATRVESAIGAGRIGLLHVNDSRDPPGSHRDRHETLGDGTIGLAGFGALFRIPEFAGVPMLARRRLT